MPPLAEADLRGLVKRLGAIAWDILRRGEPIARRLGIGTQDFREEELIALLVKHPDLIQRSIILCGDATVLGRPPENFGKLL